MLIICEACTFVKRNQKYSIVLLHCRIVLKEFVRNGNLNHAFKKKNTTQFTQLLHLTVMGFQGSLHPRLNTSKTKT